MLPRFAWRKSAAYTLGLTLFFAAGTVELCAADPASPPEAKSAAEQIKTIAGTAEFLRAVPKHFATLQAADVQNRRVTLLLDGETVPKIWSVEPDAEVKVAGWWGRLDQFTPGDRVWAWFKTGRARQPMAVSMLADELSEQDIHGLGVLVESSALDKLVLKPLKGANRTLALAHAEVSLKDKAATAANLKPGERMYVQSSGLQARIILDAASFEKRRDAQRQILRKCWIAEGLPGTVTFLHVFSGEMDFMLDHEAIRWGRSLRLGDEVKLSANPPITAVVKQVTPWRERTQLRLVVNGTDQAELNVGQRLELRMTPPPEEIDTAAFPPDLDRPRSRDERIEWFLCSTYCACKIEGDGCTGHFYTLASCNPNSCGMPNAVRKLLGEKIDRGLTDRQIIEELLKEQGPDILRPHLMP